MLTFTFFSFFKNKRLSLLHYYFLKRYSKFFIFYLLISGKNRFLKFSSLYSFICLLFGFFIKVMFSQILLTTYVNFCFMFFIKSPFLKPLRREYLSYVSTYFSSYLKYFFFSFSKGFLRNFRRVKYTKESIIIYPENLSELPYKPYFIRNYTRLPDVNFWRFFKDRYKHPRVYKIPRRRLTKNTTKWLLLYNTFSEYFTKRPSVLKTFKFSIIKLNRYFFSFFSGLLGYSRKYMFKNFLKQVSLRNKLGFLYFKLSRKLSLFLMFYLKIPHNQVLTFIQLGGVLINGSVITDCNYIIKQTDLIYFRHNVLSLLLILLRINNSANLLFYKSGRESFKMKALPLQFKRFFFQNMLLNLYKSNANFLTMDFISPTKFLPVYFFSKYTLNVQEGYYSNKMLPRFFTFNIFFKIFRQKRQLKQFRLSLLALKKLEHLSAR